jgi:hypothetical protein
MSDNRPISEIYRLAAKAWVDKEAAASLLEETKSSILSERMAALGDIPVSRAEMTVKASPDWRDFITQMVEARKEANLAKVRLEWVRMTFTEQQSAEASKRAEMRL